MTRPRRRPRRPVNRPPGRIRLTPRAGVLAALVLVLGAGAVVPLREYGEQRARERVLQEQVAALEREHRRLRTQVTNLRDPRYLERLARECLGMVEPGEIAFVAIPEGGAFPEPRC
ncbi:MAG: septum formation initiator family protein [Actinomycetota bacterium]|nr:septum formation initiator family protein [Actinomycetota bacterium]